MRTNTVDKRAQSAAHQVHTDRMPRFEQLAADIRASIDTGVLRPGDRLPSIRESSLSRRLSITTVKRAYGLMESLGLVESRPQSGYYVRLRLPLKRPAAPPTRPPLSAGEDAPEPDVRRLVQATLQAIGTREVVPFGSPYPDPSLFPWGRLQRRMNEVARRINVWDPLHDIPPGQPELVREIARRHLHNGLDVAKEEILVTAGATEALELCLQALSRPGGAIAVESPCHYGTLQTIKRLGLRAIEVPACATQGIHVDALERILGEQRVDACLFMPNFQNPLGFVMSDERKRALVALASRHQLPIIENGVYNELYFDAPPSTLKTFDTEGLVLHCGSFSKCLAAGLRMGWILPGRYTRQVETQKFINKAFAPGLQQMAVAKFLRQDGWDRQLRAVRRTLQQRRDIMLSMLRRFFPEGTRTSEPRGGYQLWVELPASVDTLRLHREALDLGIAVAPGYIFGSGDEHRHCLRLNFSYAWTGETEAAFLRLARLASIASVSGETLMTRPETRA